MTSRCCHYLRLEEGERKYFYIVNIFPQAGLDVLSRGLGPRRQRSRSRRQRPRSRSRSTSRDNLGRWEQGRRQCFNDSFPGFSRHATKLQTTANSIKEQRKPLGQQRLPGTKRQEAVVRKRFCQLLQGQDEMTPRLRRSGSK